MTRTALFCLAGTDGAIEHAVAVASTLRERGWDSAFTSEERYAARVSRDGHAWAGDCGAFSISSWGDPRAIAAQRDSVASALRSTDPSLVVTDTFALGARLAAAMHGVPHAVLGLAVYLWPQADDAPTRLQDVRARRLAAMCSALESAERIGARCPLQDPWKVLLGELHLVRSVREFHGSLEGLPTAVRFVGHGFSRQRLSAALAVNAAKPYAFLQVEKLFGNFDFVTEATAAAESHGLLVHTALGPQLRNLPHRHADAAQAAEKMPERLSGARITINTGHTTSTLASLALGIPLVVVDHGSGGDEVGHRCGRAGVGVHVNLTEDSAAVTLRAAVSQALSSPEMRARAGQLASAFCAVDSLATIASSLEALALHPSSLCQDASSCV